MNKQQKIIIVKNLNSHLYEGAYFILRNDSRKFKDIGEKDMIKEAERIINDHMPEAPKKKKNKQRNSVFFFLSGAVACGLLTILVHSIL